MDIAIGLAICVLALALAFVVHAYGLLAARPQVPDSFALPLDEAKTELDRTVDPLETPDKAQTGLLLLSSNLDAFAARVVAARNAGRSLDLMYYLWRGDLTGTLLAREVLAAADRGVRVRLLLDDINTRDSDPVYAALDSHPHIAVRLFNPVRARERGIARGIEMILRHVSINRRMHNKAWIADSRLAIVGGRNIANAYFDAGKTNFRDLDLLMFGNAAKETERVFDAFWNSGLSLPIPKLTKVRSRSLKSLRAQIERTASSKRARPFLARVDAKLSVASLLEEVGPIHWSRNVTVVADPPEKAAGEGEGKWLMRVLAPIIDSSLSRLRLVSPYFIPGAEGCSRLEGMVRRGVSVSVLTNSLAATDVAAVHGAYAPYREKLLKAGVRLFELQPYEHRRNISVFGSKGGSLHTKAFLVDERVGFIGSFNFDPRSLSLNTEMGVLFEAPSLAEKVGERFASDTSMQSSFELSLSEDGILWTGEVDGEERRYASDPEASLGRRVLAAVVGWLPIEAQL